MEQDIQIIIKNVQDGNLDFVEATKKVLNLFNINREKKHFNCGKERVFGEEKCEKQCDVCLKEYSNQ